jgi:hypothetical protein
MRRMAAAAQDGWRRAAVGRIFNPSGSGEGRIENLSYSRV